MLGRKGYKQTLKPRTVPHADHLQNTEREGESLGSPKLLESIQNLSTLATLCISKREDAKELNTLPGTEAGPKRQK